MKHRRCAQYIVRCVTLTSRFPKIKEKRKEILDMSKLMEGNKRYLFWVVVIGLFGIVGLLMVPIVKCIIRVSERHPKACRWIIIVAFISITIYQLIEQGWISGFGWICIGVVLATNSMFKDNSK